MEPRPATSGTRWARAKLVRAGALLGHLDSSISSWRSRANLRGEGTISEDRLRFDLVLRLDEAPPLDEWALIAGDVVHNLRSSLDVLVWAHARAGELSESQQRSICFPVVFEEAKWAQAVTRNLATIDPGLIERVRACQPFAVSHSEGAIDGLATLSELDNQDKHRLALQTVAAPHGASHSFGIEFENEEAAARNQPPDTTVWTPELRDGALLLEQRCVTPIVKVRGEFSIEMRLILKTRAADLPLLGSLGGLLTWTDEILHHLVEESPKPPD